MCMQFPQFECTFWFPFALYVENVRQPNYFLHKNKCIGYFIHDLHLEKVLLFIVVMDSVIRGQVKGESGLLHLYWILYLSLYVYI